MALFTRVSGSPISTTVGASCTMLVGISTRESSLMTWHKVLVSIGTPMAPSMLATGTKTSSTALERRSGMMEVSTRDSTKMHPKRAKVNTAGQMETDSWENGAIICSMVKVFPYGTTIECSSETGKTT